MKGSRGRGRRGREQTGGGRGKEHAEGGTGDGGKVSRERYR